jgi:hypothetical protein
VHSFTGIAFKSLWSYWDEMLHHERRYNIMELSSILSQAGLIIKRITYSNSFIFLPAIAVRQLKRLRNNSPETQASDFMPVPPLLNTVLVFLYRIEATLLRRISFPFGLSIVCLATKE